MHCAMLVQSSVVVYIDVQNQVKYGGHMDFFLSRCFRKLLDAEDKKWFCHKSSALDQSFSRH